MDEVVQEAQTDALKSTYHFCVCGNKMVHYDAIPDFEMFSGWYCELCGYFELDEG